MSKSRVEYLIGRKIRTAATNAGMTLAALGERLGVSRPTIYAYATGALHVPESRLNDIARVTGQSIDFFTVKDEEETVNLSERIRLIDATLSPPDPKAASMMATAIIESTATFDDPTSIALLAFRAGNALLQQGDYLDAIQQLEHARKTYLSLGQVRYAASCSQSIGYCYINLGKIDKAKDCFEYSKNYSAPDQKWLGTISLAALSERIGDFDQAQVELERLLRSSVVEDEVRAYITSNLASIYCVRTDWKEAQAVVEDALDQAFAMRLADQVIEMLVLDSSIRMRTGEIEKASESLIRAGDVCLGLGDESRKALIDVAWAEFNSAISEFDRAREYAVNALSAATRGQYRRSEGQALRVLAEIALRKRDYDLARDYGMQLASHSVTHQYPVAECQSNLIMGSALFELGAVDKAEELCAVAVRSAEMYRLPEVHLRAQLLDARISPSFDKGEHACHLIEDAISENLMPLAWQIYRELSPKMSDDKKQAVARLLPGIPQTFNVAVINAGQRHTKTLINSATSATM